MSAVPDSHRWRFFRAGGFDQVRLDSADDLLALESLDQKLWVALACPTHGLEFDPTTLQLLDADGDGRIRAPDLIAALHWCGARLTDPELVARGTQPLPLAAIATHDEEGTRLQQAARTLIARLGKDADDASLGAEEAATLESLFAREAFNGDGVITALAAGDDEGLKTLIGEIVAVSGGRRDRSGESGIDRELLQQFHTAARALAEWQAQPAGQPAILPLGAATADAAATVDCVRAKIDDYFARCRLSAFDARATPSLNGSEADFQALGARLLAAADAAALPLARIAAGRPLPLAAGVNPAWAAALGKFASEVVTPLLGARDELAEAGWQAIGERFAAWHAWQAARPADALAARIAATLSPERIAAITAGDGEARLAALIDADAARAEVAAELLAVHRLVLYVRDLAKLAENFVSFRRFYARQEPAIFQCGTLYLDERSCELCLPVLDAGKHAAIAAQSGIYLAYCDCVRGAEKMTIAAAFTAGDSDNLAVGRNGVFYDRQGRDWDATITRIVDQPISLSQAFWSPYKKLARLLAEQMEKFAAARAKAIDDSAAAAAAKVPAAAAAPEAAKPAPFDIGRFVGIFAAIGLAIGAIGGALAALATGFLGLAWWQMPLAIAGLLLIVSLPAVALAAFRLRKRNLGPLLDANGWAVNARARINIPFGGSLTQVARLPAGAERSLADPYAEKKHPWFFYLLLILVAAALAAVTVRSLGV